MKEKTDKKEAPPGSSEKACIGPVAVAVPAYCASQKEADEFFTRHYSQRLKPRSLSLLHKLFEHPAISRRAFAFDDPSCLIDEDPDSRIERFRHWAVNLSSDAVTRALDCAGIDAKDVSSLVVNTCTGYICPGISTYLIEKLGLPRNVRAFDLVGSGCGGAIPNLQVAASQLNTEGVVLSVSVEICSATFQMDDDLSLLLSNALFGDGAAAAVIWRRQEGFEIVDSASVYVPQEREHIRYIHKKGLLYNRLSTVLPRLVRKAVSEVVPRLLAPRSLRVGDISHWALHNGGEKVIKEVKYGLGLSEAQLASTRAVLSEYGNMSSPTVWFVLKDILDKGVGTGDWCVMLAFGAGLSAHACLLRKS
jgi:predicted naringenin-chalcone synthase